MDELGAAPKPTRIRLTGKRFEGGRLPIESLAELEHYQAGVRLIAEHKWLREHPGESLPKDFARSIGLVIEKITNGSADVILAFEREAQYRTYALEARDAVDTTIAAAYSGAIIPDLPDDISDDVRQELAGIGATLQPGQTIELYEGDWAAPVKISVDTRPAAVDRLILDDFLSEPVPQMDAGVTHETTSLVARVTVVDAERMRYELNSEQYGRILGRYAGNPAILDDLRALVNSTSEGPLSRIHGDLRSKFGKPWGFWTTSSVERVQFDDTPWGRTLTSFVTLPSGWADGHGNPISATALDAAQTLLQRIDVDRRPPALAPTEGGGVLIEWITAAGIRSVEILEDGTLELFAMRASDRRGSQVETLSVAEAAEFVDEDFA